MIPHIITFFTILYLPYVNSVDFNYPTVFNFGDSNSDTGELAAGYGFFLDPPNGQSYFKTPSGRYCDGRLIVIIYYLGCWYLKIES
ncbi:SGNH hydrolase-type esterase domain containing protein [Parasponia andersonii]|uniref:SGNH hydrolase-type esterase domain containing protein n=1 Tax=Parasponia andersonii TaxID=3476 RepID=A0A2P5CTR1_PARAD|nr:SGNH hydrolase-type esterase domain containing protein [Parasponia andersonii]